MSVPPIFAQRMRKPIRGRGEKEGDWGLGTGDWGMGDEAGRLLLVLSNRVEPRFVVFGTPL